MQIHHLTAVEKHLGGGEFGGAHLKVIWKTMFTFESDLKNPVSRYFLLIAFQFVDAIFSLEKICKIIR